MLSGDQSNPIDFQPGSVIAERFEIVRCLGVGSMGIVYLAYDLSKPHQPLAIKVLSPAQHLEGSVDVFFERFANEVRACSQVHHKHVVRFHEFVKQEGLTAYTMEYVAGGDLAIFMRNESPICIPKVIQMLDQMALGVEAIHAAGIIHRDLKPANILLTERQEVKIADFGIARAEGSRKITAPGGVVGTIDYLSPQYLENGQVDPQGDLYSLGVLAYQMIVGKTPFAGSGFYQSIELKLHTDPVPPHEARSDCPKNLSDVVMQALKRDPAERYKTAGEFHQALEPLLQEFPLSDAERTAPLRKRVNSGGSRVVEVISLKDLCVGESAEAARQALDRKMDSWSESVTSTSAAAESQSIAEPTPQQVYMRRRPSPFVLGGIGTLLGMLIVLVLSQGIGTQKKTIRDENAETQLALRNSADAQAPGTVETQENIEKTESISTEKATEQNIDGNTLSGSSETQVVLNLTTEAGTENPLETSQPLKPEVVAEANRIITVTAENRAVAEAQEIAAARATESLTKADTSEAPAAIAPIVVARNVGQELIIKPELSVPVADSSKSVAASEGVSRAMLKREPAVVKENLQAKSSATPSRVLKAPAPMQVARVVAPSVAAKVSSSNSSATEISEKTTPTRANQPTTESAISIEYKVRATLLYRFADYVQWPAASFDSPTSPLSICIVGNDPFGSFLDNNLSRVQSKTLRGYKLVRVSASSVPSSLRNCQLAYLSGEDSKFAARMVKEVNALGLHTLIVAEDSGEAVIDFVMVDRKVKFEINTKRATEAGLKIAPLLLDLAVKVN